MLVGMARDRGLIKQGEQNQILKSLREVERSVKIAKDIENETDEMTDEEIDKDLEQDYRD
jgi:hypothetical protein